ncbi:MAG: MBL fold metallo-hydrolase [Lachnospiraceae bacterium]|nr:MBL fold metallo-hydrolase [Lachnospiraceae bacterium]
MKEFVNAIVEEESGLALFAVGQAGYIIKSQSGQLLGIDLYLSECVERVEGHIGFKRLLPKILNPLDLVFDVIIATHPHYDHFDVDSIPLLMSNEKTYLYASLNCAEEVQRLNMKSEKISYVKAGDSDQYGDFGLEFVNCDHGTGAPDAFGVIISVDGKRIYMSGDTCLRLDRVDEILARGLLDVLIAPINGAFGNMNEIECAELSNALKPRLTIPSHYGMFASHGGNPGVFVNIMNKKFPDNQYILMAMGEKIIL